MRRFKYWLIVICFLSVIPSCGGQGSEKITEIPIPIQAQPAKINDAAGSDLIRTMTIILRSLQEKYGSFDEKVYRLPSETNWREVSNFYEKTAREKDWQKETDFPAENVNSTVTVWRDENSGSKKNVAVAFIEIERQDTGKQKFLTIFTSR